jgi:hypothetical protein
MKLVLRNRRDRTVLLFVVECGEVAAMARTRKKFTASKEARRRARLAAGSPPAARVIPDKRLKPPKHKKPAGFIGEP